MASARGDANQQLRHGRFIPVAWLHKWLYLLHWLVSKNTKKILIKSSIHYILSFINIHTCIADMQKFPLRMKDNDLLVTELYRDPSAEMVTSISVYLTPKTSTLNL